MRSTKKPGDFENYHYFPRSKKQTVRIEPNMRALIIYEYILQQYINRLSFTLRNVLYTYWYVHRYEYMYY
jgi:hypothetical protein